MSHKVIYNDALRLEIEVPADGLPNLVQNPNGEFGGWGYVTPVNGTAVTSQNWYPVDILRYNDTKNAVGASYFTTEHMPVAAGRYVAARFRIISSNLYPKCRFEWYDVDKNLLSSSTQTANLGSDGGVKYVPSALAPVNTAYVKLRFDMYSSTGNNPYSGFMQFDGVMVTHAASTAGLGTSRTNIIPNGDFEEPTLISGWNAYANSTIINAPIAAGSDAGGSGGALRINSVASGLSEAAADNIAIQGGQSYTLSAYFKSPSASWNTTARLGVFFYTASGSYIVGYGYDRGTYNNTSWTRKNVTFTTPSNAAYVKVLTGFHALGASHGAWVDGVMMEAGTVLNDYYKGTYSSGATYDYAEPYAWQNILGPTHDISIQRKELDVGLMSATVLDAYLDPAVSDTIRPGKRIRLLAYVEDRWEYIYSGKVSNAIVSYPKDKTPGAKVQTRIELTASDAVADLANQGEGSGVASIGQLPNLLEGKGVPWNVNGSGGQVLSAAVVSWNENASVLDQVAITRDTNRGYAWVARNGVLNVWDRAWIGTEVEAYFDDTSSLSYTDIDVDYNIERCINQVAVKWLRYDIGNDSTTEVHYPEGGGYYPNAASIDKWGPRAATFTIHGATESSSSIASFAQQVLDANANPVIAVNRLTMPVRNEDELAHAATLDIYSNVHITYDTKIDDEYRITGIEHRITPDKWNVTYEFDTVNSVASPTWTPSPPFKGVSGGGGEPGEAATVSVGSTTTGAAGTNASVTNSGTSSAAVLNFTIPRGAQGNQGIQGVKGDTGPAGPNSDTNRPIGQISRTTNQSIANNTTTQIQFTSTNENVPSGFASTASNRLVAPATGLYMVDLYVVWVGDSGTTGIRQTNLVVNGSNVKVSRQAASGSTVNYNGLAAVVRLNAGDLITAEAFQNSGAARSVGSGTYLQAVRIGF